jgi:SAM-dependent methyltransferase
MRISTLRYLIRDFVHAALALLVALCVPPAAAVDVPAGAEPYKPKVGQGGKDVMWVPTPQKAVERMLEMAQVGPSDFVIDLGSGDGRIVITAAKQYGARGYGVDLNPDMVKLSEHRARQAGVAERVKFHVRDIFATDLSAASVVTMYLLPELNLKLRPVLWKLAPGTRIVTHAFDMGEWEADETDTSTSAMLRLWVVPARIAGIWLGSLKHAGQTKSFELDINQQYQRLSGVVRLGTQRMRLRDTKLRGEAIGFALVDQQRADTGVRYDFTGRAKGDTIEGEMVASDSKQRSRWAVTRRNAINMPAM